MRIKLIHPNTTWSMTEKIGACARAVARPGTEVVDLMCGTGELWPHLAPRLGPDGCLTGVDASDLLRGTLLHLSDSSMVRTTIEKALEGTAAKTAVKA